MMDNRVLNNRSPPMNEKEVHLSRRQRATLYHSSVPDIANFWIPTKSDWSKLILQVVLTVEWIHMMYLTWSVAWLTPMIRHLWIYRASQSIRYGNWAFWTRGTWINRWVWLKRAYNNNTSMTYTSTAQNTTKWQILHHITYIIPKQHSSDQLVVLSPISEQTNIPSYFHIWTKSAPTNTYHYSSPQHTTLYLECRTTI